MLTLTSIASAADPPDPLDIPARMEPERPEHPEQRPDVRDESGDGMRHGVDLPDYAVFRAPVGAVSNPTIQPGHNSAISDCDSDAGLSPVNAKSEHHNPLAINASVAYGATATETEPSEKGNNLAHASPVAAGGRGHDLQHSFAADADSGNPARAQVGAGIGAQGDRQGPAGAATERQTAVAGIRLVPCPMCAGSGRGHIRACSLCRGECGLRIAVYPDDTGIAPNWARYHAYLDDEYDGAPDAGPRASAIGCGQTPDEAVADLIERMCP